MSYREMITLISQQAGLTQLQTRAAVDSLAMNIKIYVRSGKEVRISGLGRFAAITMRPTRRRDIDTGKIVDVPERKAVRFYPSKTGFVVK